MGAGNRYWKIRSKNRMAKVKGYGEKVINTQKKITSIGKSRRTRVKNKHKRRHKKGR